ncbi:MAG: response regulator, partial [Oscillospiraceae bacterium]|nr:response regulator [Oscillospiraceae bacterium]
MYKSHVFIIVFCSFAVFSYSQLSEQRKLREKAILANKSKSEFLSNMSHDIRTPMNVIVGVTDMARSRIDDKEKVKEYLEKIARSSKHLLSLINDVLDMSQIESGKMTLTPVQISLCESMENIVAIIQPQIKNKQQKFDIYIKNIIQENVFCDGLRLNQVLINLLSNAVKYTQKEGQIILMLSQENSPKGDDYVRNHIIVKDNGIGMTEEFQKVVFHSFSREDMARVSKEEGTGLGLAITKHIVDVMGGTITVKSKLNEGSEFHVTVDLKKCNLEEKDIIFDNLNVLVIDDDEELCQSAVHSLKELNANAEYVTSGADAIEKIKTSANKFDVILVDWQMPHMNGIETVKNIHQYTDTEIPIILISAYDWSDIEDQAKEAGINGFIAKPLFKSTLFFGINQHINKT